MPLGVGSGMFAIVLPKEATNLLTCPSYEFGRTGQTAALTGGVTDIGTTSAFGQFGAWSMYVVPSAAPGTSGAYVGTWASGNGTDYTASAYVRGSASVPYVMAVADFTTTTFIGSVLFTGGGTWQRYSVPYTETGDTVRRLVVGKASGNNAGTYYIDGVQVEVGSITSYFDGDEPGCTWNGAPHASTSTRSGQYRGGGSVVALSDLGWQVNQMPGVGMPPVENSAQSYAIIDGAQFQRQRTTARKLTLTAAPWHGTSLADFHRLRSDVIDALKIDSVTPQQPVRLIYVGGRGTVQIDAYYDSGLELGNMDGPIAEAGAVSFIATDPYWYAPTQEGTTLATRMTLAGSYAVYRTKTGVWGTLGANSSSFDEQVKGMTVGNGSVFFGGLFTKAGGGTAPFAAIYNPASRTFGSLAGGGSIIGGANGINALVYAPSGTLFLGGGFTGAGGTAGARNVAQWNGAGFGSLIGGTVDNVVFGLAYSPTGTLFIGGAHVKAGGSTAPGLAIHNGAAYGTLLGQAGGTIDGIVNEVQIAPDGRAIFGGLFGSGGGTAMRRIGQWFGSFGTMGSAVGAGVSPAVNGIAFGANGVVFAGGDFSTIGGIVVGSADGLGNAGQWNGVAWSAMSRGLGTTSGDNIKTLIYDPVTTSVIAGGAFALPNSGVYGPAVWNGYSWVPLDFTPNGQILAMAIASDRSLFIGGNFTGGTAASVGTIVNTGRSQAYPTIRLRNLSSGTARVFQVVNTTTGAGIYFDLSLLPGERATLDLTPGARSFQSSFRDNLMSSIVPGSQLATWSLLPGPNTVSCFSDNSSLEASIFWQRRGWSIDSGTVT